MNTESIENKQDLLPVKKVENCTEEMSAQEMYRLLQEGICEKGFDHGCI